MLNFLFGGAGSKIKCLGEKGCMDFYDLSLEASHLQIHPDSRRRNTDPPLLNGRSFKVLEAKF